MAITGYPPEDLVYRRDFVDANLAALARVVRVSRGFRRMVSVVGFVEREDDALFNAAAVIAGGRVLAVYRKQLLPNYGVFDERRYFSPGAGSPVISADGLRLGVTICEDLWHPGEAPARALAGSGVDLVVNLSASPYETGKIAVREKLFSENARRAGSPLAYVNLVGGQDELVFDGRSMVFDVRGRVAGRAKSFGEDLLIADIGTGGSISVRGGSRPIADPLEEIHGALVLGIRDYARKNGFAGAVLGLSGGIDSAFTAVLAADALGPKAVTGVSLPSRFTSDASRDDARALAARLGIGFLELPIERMFSTYLEVLGRHTDGEQGDLARQNLQARIRGATLMALSNRYGWLLLATGNKSEMSAGYATLYGDLAGGFAPLKDVPKTLVYRLARWRNRRGRPIPTRSFTRPPTAELKPGQKDSDNLPPYPVLDPILKEYVEERRSPREITRRGYSPTMVKRVAAMVERSEYKRRQAPPGVKIMPHAFGKDRRNPITHGFRP
jgi:NAD+ synthase (glutamine-hydrolysing)